MSVNVSDEANRAYENLCEMIESRISTVFLKTDVNTSGHMRKRGKTYYVRLDTKRDLKRPPVCVGRRRGTETPASDELRVTSRSVDR